MTAVSLYERALVRLRAFRMLKGWGVEQPDGRVALWDLETRKRHAADLADWALKEPDAS